ncbi:MAG TPA: cupin domain-containing protein [Chloroflexota bacterium]
MGRVLDNPRSGERIVVRRSAQDTDGELLEFDVFLRPGAHVPARHVHPRQVERFSVLVGRVRFSLGRRAFLACAGDSVLVPSGTPHWFGNAGPDTAQVRVEVRPAMRMEELFETTVEHAARATGWRRLVMLGLVLLDFRHEVAVPDVPSFAMVCLLTPLAWLRPRLSR